MVASAYKGNAVLKNAPVHGSYLLWVPIILSLWGAVLPTGGGKGEGATGAVCPRPPM